MVQKILPLLLFPLLLYSNECIEKKFTFETPRVQNEMVVLKGCRISREGFAPCVAVKPVMLVLPKGQEAVSFEVNYSGFTHIPGEHYLRPFMPSVNMEIGPDPEMHRCRSAVYDRNEYFPGTVESNWFRMQYKTGIPIFITLVKPVQYNPITGRIRYCKEVTVRVHTRATRKPVFYNASPASKSIVQSMVDNADAVSKLPVVSKKADAYDYLIVSSDALADGWGAFTEFNKRRGMRSKVVTISEVKAASQGRDDAEKLRNYIIKEYEDNGITFVMLGGDDNPGSSSDIPDREMRAQFYDHHIAPERFHDERDLSAEMYYSCLDGDWITDSSGNEKEYFGEPGTEDMFWDVYACRFPVDNTSELTNIINKTIKYTESPVKGEVTNIFLAGNYLWSNSGVDVYGGMHMDEYLDVCNANTYTTYGFPTSTWNVTKLYEQENTWTIGTFRTRVNSTKPTWIEHLGHGNTTYAFLETNAGVNNSNYKNNGTDANYFIITTGACYPGNFEDNQDCLLEMFLRIENGAVAVQGFEPSGLEDDDGTDGVGQRTRRFFHDAIFNPDKQMHWMQMAHGNAKEANAEIILNPDIETPPYFGAMRFICYGLNFHGDPALSFWTDEPEDLTPDYPSPLTSTKFTWDSKLPYAWLALCDEQGEIITTQMAGHDGKFEIKDDQALIDYLTQNPDKDLKVIIKAGNYMTYTGNLEVGPTVIAHNAIASHINSFHHYGNTALLRYTLRSHETVTIGIYNAKGMLLKPALRIRQVAGRYTLPVAINNLSNGIYYCTLTTGTMQHTHKFIITR